MAFLKEQVGELKMINPIVERFGGLGGGLHYGGEIWYTHHVVMLVSNGYP